MFEKFLSDCIKSIDNVVSISIKSVDNAVSSIAEHKKSYIEMFERSIEFRQRFRLAAEVSYEVGRAYNGGKTAFKNLPLAFIDSRIRLMKYIEENPDATTEMIHAGWRKILSDDGWAAGGACSMTNKTSKLLVEFNELSPDDIRNFEIMIAAAKPILFFRCDSHEKTNS